MEFTVPKFIEKEPKIIGPFTFKQCGYIGVAGGILIFLYFTLPFFLFLIFALFLLGGAFVLVFLKIEGIPLPTVIKNAFFFFGKPKLYLWKKKAIFPKIARKLELPKEEKEGSPLKIAEKSRLRDLFTHLETRTK